MPVYQFLGLPIELPWSLGMTASRQAARVRVVMQPAEEAFSASDESEFSVNRVGEQLELHFPNLCRMLLPGPEGGVLSVAPVADADENELKRQLLEHAIPRLLSREHALVLHASSVEQGAFAARFLARSGSGKSTLALAMARRGASMLSDDSLVIDLEGDTAIARPLWSNVRIHTRDLSSELKQKHGHDEHSAQKVALHAGDDPLLRFSEHARPLGPIYLIEEAEEHHITKVAPRDALLSLVRESYHLEFDDFSGLSRLMGTIEKLGLTRRTYRYAYPRDFDRLEETCDFLARHVASLS